MWLSAKLKMAAWRRFALSECYLVDKLICCLLSAKITHDVTSLTDMPVFCMATCLVFTTCRGREGWVVNSSVYPPLNPRSKSSAFPLPPLLLLSFPSPSHPFPQSLWPPFHPFPCPFPAGPPLNPARESGERCKLPQRGPERSPDDPEIWCI